MNLTEFQKQILKEILDGKISNLAEFVTRHITTQSIVHGTVVSHEVGVHHTSTDFSKGALIISDPDYMQKFSALHQLLHFLEIENLIIPTVIMASVVSQNVASVMILHSSGSPTVDKGIFQMLYKYFLNGWQPSINLTDFVENGFLLPKEREYSQEQANRKTAELWTRILAISSLLINLSVSGYNAFKQPKNELTIKNTPEIVEAIKGATAKNCERK